MLPALTTTLDLTGMSIGLWLAFYVLARGYRSGITLRGFIVLLCIALFFFGAYINIFNQIPGSAAWRAVLLITALFFWYDLTRKLLPISMRQRTRVLRWASLFLAVATAVVLVTVPNAFLGEAGNSLNIGRMAIEFPFLLYAIYMIEISVAMLFNHSLMGKAGLSRKYRYFFSATLLAVVNVAHGILSLAILPPQSRVVQDGLVLASIVVLGFSVARHQTFVERRTTFRDLPVSGLTVLGVSGIFAAAGLALDLTPEAVGVLVALAVLSLASYDFIRVALDTVLHRRISRMRQQLLRIARGSGDAALTGAGITAGLRSLCQSVQAEEGLVARSRSGDFEILANYNTVSEGTVFDVGVDLKGDLVEINGRHPLELSWVAPCTWAGETLAIVGIGMRTSGGIYNEGDLDLLTEFADQVALLLHLEDLQVQQSDRLSVLAAEYQAGQVLLQTGKEAILERISQKPDAEVVSWVEDALRNLSDYSHLGRSPLVNYLGVDGETHLDQGRRLREKLLEIMDVMRPSEKRPSEPLPREWYSYAVLYDAYVEDVPNREIMARLYISEGTFNRTRRKAIRALARSIQETQLAG